MRRPHDVALRAGCPAEATTLRESSSANPAIGRLAVSGEASHRISGSRDGRWARWDTSCRGLASSPAVIRTSSAERRARSSTASSSATGGHPATNTGFHTRAGAAAMLPERETATPSRKANHMTARVRRSRPWDGFRTPTVASRSNPSTDNGHSLALVRSAPPCNTNSR